MITGTTILKSRDRCECFDCSDSDSPCFIYAKTTTCQEERPSDEWCEGCQQDLNMEYEALKAEEKQCAAEREYEERSGR